MLWLLLGDYREGKTLRLVFEAYDPKYKYRTIYANFKLIHPNVVQVHNPTELENLNNCLVLLDEMQNWFNSHRTFSNTNEFFTDFIHDCDKGNVDVFGTSHRFMSNEKDFRLGCHRVIKCVRKGHKNPNVSRLNDKRDFRYWTVSMTTGKIISKKRMPYLKAKKYFSLYDTTERIKRPEDKTRRLLLLWEHDPIKADLETQKIVKDLIPIFENGIEFNHINVAKQLGKLGFGLNETLRKIFYSEIKQKLKESEVLKELLSNF